MLDALTIGWIKAQARARKSTYQRVLGFNMALHVGIGLVCMFIPYFVSETCWSSAARTVRLDSRLGRDADSGDGALCSRPPDPLRSRFPNIVGLIGRVWMATVWFVVGGGLVWFGVFDFSFAIILAWLFASLLRRGAYEFCCSMLLRGAERRSNPGPWAPYVPLDRFASLAMTAALSSNSMLKRRRLRASCSPLHFAKRHPYRGVIAGAFPCTHHTVHTRIFKPRRKRWT